MAEKTRADLITLVDQIRRHPEANALIRELERSVVDPEVTDYIFWAEPELTAEQIVDKALAYEPILLGPPAEKRD